MTTTTESPVIPGSYEPISDTVSAEDILAVAQHAYRQPEGTGMRVANRSEFTFIAPVIQPDGGARFRERAVKGQMEAAYWEGMLGTVHDLRIVLFDSDRHVLFAATYSDDFKPYVADVIKLATPWLDYLFDGVAAGYPGLSSPEIIPYLLKYQVEAQVWYAAHQDSSVRDVTRSLTLSSAFDHLLDAAQG